MSKYIISLGTSHTYGDCNGRISESTYADQIASRLGVENKNFSMSGNENIDILQTYNEIRQDYINKNCLFVIADVRVRGFQYKIPKSLYMDFNNYKHTSDGRLADLSRTIGFKSWHEHEKFKFWKHTKYPEPGYTRRVINRHTGEYFSASSTTVERITELCELNDDAKKLFPSNIVTNRTMIKNAINVISNLIVAEAKVYNYKRLFENYIHICSLKNMVTATGVDFYWFDFNNDNFENIENYKDFDKSINNYKLYNDAKNYSEKFKCGCGHLNEEGHKKLSEELYKQIENKYE